jgi:hypothetical protein
MSDLTIAVVLERYTKPKSSWGFPPGDPEPGLQPES